MLDSSRTQSNSYCVGVGVGVGVGVCVGACVEVGVGVSVAAGAVVGESVAVGGTAVGATSNTTKDTVNVAPNKLCPLDKRQELVYVPGFLGASKSTESSDQLQTGTVF